MKKIITFIGIIIIVFMIIGCTPNKNERDEIIDILSSEKIINGKKYKEIDKEELKYYSGWSCQVFEYYIYENSDGDRIGVLFNKKSQSNTEQYDITLYNSVEEETDLDYYDEEPDGCIEEKVYRTKDNKPSKNSKYILDDSKKYTIVIEGRKHTIKDKEEKQ